LARRGYDIRGFRLQAEGAARFLFHGGSTELRTRFHLKVEATGCPRNLQLKVEATARSFGGRGYDMRGFRLQAEAERLTRARSAVLAIFAS